MSRFPSQAFLFLGVVLLFHAYSLCTIDHVSRAMLTATFLNRCYSAHEHSSIHTISPRQSGFSSLRSAQPPSPNLPIDMSLETILSVAFICIGLVLGAEELKPICWRVWAGKTERERGSGGPFQGLESRPGFVDIRVSSPLRLPRP